MMNFNPIEMILLIAFVGSFVTAIAFYTVRPLQTTLALATVFVLSYLVFMLPSEMSSSFVLGGFELEWGINPFSKLFAGLIAIGSIITLVFSIPYMAKREHLGYYYLNFMLTIASMYGIVFSQDLLSLFIFWEIMTWSSFFLVIYSKEEGQSAGIQYFLFSAFGAFLMLIAMVMINSEIATLSINELFNQWGVFSANEHRIIIALFTLGFGVKAAMMPLHVWAPNSYAASPAPFTALFSGVLSKMGIYGLVLIVLKLSLLIPEGYWFRHVLAWVGGLTALLATIYATTQDDARKLLAYSSVGQLGYIITGIAIGTEMSIMGALFLAILHGAFKGMLFLAIGAVYYRTGSTDMREVTGLIRNMPFTFVATLIGIITIAGVPPLGGFVAKWLLYEALITEGYYFLVVVIFAASTAAFLYLFKLIHTIFLGQEEPQYKDVKEAPLAMIIPMMILAVGVMVVGTYPGLLFTPIESAMNWIGISTGAWHTSVLFNTWGDTVDLLSVSSSIGTIFILGAIFITLKNRKTTRYVTTKDIHTAGEIPTENENMSFAVDFYQPFHRATEPVLRYSISDIYSSFAKNMESMFDTFRFIYTGNAQTYAIYTIIFLVTLVVFSEWFFGISL